MSKSYVNVYQSGRNELTHVYIEDNDQKTEKLKFKPFLGVYATSKEESKWTDIFGKAIKPIVFDSISDMQNWKKENKDVLDILGDINPVYQFISSRYNKEECSIQKKGMNIFNFDIECMTDGKFPKPEIADQLINAITVQDMVKDFYHIFSLKPYSHNNTNVKYYYCSSEEDLLIKFIGFLSDSKVNVLTGWNIQTFDIPYIYNRCKRLFGNDNLVSKISQDNKIKQHEKTNPVGKKDITYSFDGVTIWDYIELYKKFQMDPRESYSLDNIAKVELGDSKVKFLDDHDDLNSLYENDFDTFISYNQKDVQLVYDLNQKLGFIELALTLMYSFRCTPEDIFGTVTPWDASLYYELFQQKKLCPARKNSLNEEYPGGYVAEPKTGMHKWLMVFDISSSYPNQIISYNLSTETIIDDKYLPPELIKIRKEFGSIEKCLDINKLSEINKTLKEFDCCFCSNGHFFRTDIQGFMPEIIGRIFNERKEIKKKMKELRSNGLMDEYNKFDKIQHARKIQINSFYGALANIHFRYFDIRMASAITCNGQLSIRGAEKYLLDNIKGLTNVYIDTDSLSLSLEKIIDNRFKDSKPSIKEIITFIVKLSDQIIQPKLKEYFKLLGESLNVNKMTINMEAECIADTAIFVAKKKYIMNKVWDEGEWLDEKPKLKIRGVEIVRTSTPQVVRDKLKEAVNIIFKTQSNEKLIEFINETKTEFFKLPFEKVAFPRGVNFSQYNIDSKSLPIHVRASFIYNNILDSLNLKDKYQPIGDGNKVKFAYVETPNKFRSNVIACLNKMPEEISKYFVIDYSLQFQKAFLQPLEGITSTLGWHTEEKNSLEDFFS